MGASSRLRAASAAVALAAATVLVMPASAAAVLQPPAVAASELASQIVAGESVDLTGAVVQGDLTLPRTTRVTAPVRCRNCRFAGSVRGTDTAFGRGLELDGSVVEGDFDFSGASFDDRANLEDLRFSGPVLLRGARFGDGVSFREARFEGPATFDHVRVKGAASFTGASFGGPAAFPGAEFAAKADFSQTSFAGDASFDGAVFDGLPTFSLAELAGRVSFDGAELRAGGSFQFAHFADVSFERSAAAGLLAFDEAVVDGEASLDGLSSSGSVSLRGMHIRSRSLFVERMVAKELAMDVELVPAIRGRTAQKRMLRTLETSAKERGDLSVANDARFHLLSMNGEEKEGVGRLVDDTERIVAGYLVRPARPIASFVVLVMAAAAVRWAFAIFLVLRGRPSGQAGWWRVTMQKGGFRRLVGIGSRTLALGFESVSDSLAVAFRLHAGVITPSPDRLRSYGVALGGWAEFLAYKVLLGVILLTIGNANATVRELLESVRP